MNRLQLEVHRLYGPPALGGQDRESGDSGLIDAGGRVRAMVLELARPAAWDALSTVWNGVQVDLALPAPAIAVSGKDGYQLWFSLAEPVPAPQAMAFLESLRLRYLSDIKVQRIALWPTVDASSPLQVQHARRVPAPQAEGGRWSAFIAPDLAPVFAEEPWLDLPPNAEGQSNLLSGLASIAPADFQHALERLGPTVSSAPAPPAPEASQTTAAGLGPLNIRSTPAGAWLDPKRFLLEVMNNDTVALGLRIEAAKALLPYFDDARRP